MYDFRIKPEILVIIVESLIGVRTKHTIISLHYYVSHPTAWTCTSVQLAKAGVAGVNYLIEDGNNQVDDPVA